MKNTKYLIVASALVLTLAGCSEDREAFTGEGRVLLSARLNSDVKVVSRAATEQQLGESAVIWLSNAKGPVRKYKGINSVPAEGIWLASDSYTAEAWAGDSVSASFDHKYYKGVERFDVTSGSTARVEVVCHVANVVTSVNYDAAVDDVLSDYIMTVSHNRGELKFEGRDDRKGYFMMPSTDKNLTWTLAGTDNTGKPFSRSGVIENVQSRHEYVLNVRMTGSTDAIGGAFITIEVDDRTNDIEDTVTISSVPDIKGYNFDIAQGINGEQGTIGRRTVWVLASTKLSRVELQCPYFATLLGDPAEVDFDFRNMTDDYRANLAAKGINAVYDEDAVSGTSRMKINFEEAFTNSLPNGTYDIAIIAEDATGKEARQTLKIAISDAPMQTSAPVTTPDVLHATYTTVSAVIVKDAVNPGIEYREAGAGAWTRADDVAVSGNTVTARLAGLTPGTRYEYRAVCDGFEAADVKSFTTEAAPQIPNGGFEDWCMDGNIQRLSATPGDFFWDSGNKGSTTLGAKWNLTVPESTVKHSGNYSAKLESKKVVIAFAAGNCFVGEFIGTENTKYGILGWGREFVGRPKALHGWVKYTPQPIDNVASGTPGECVKGNMDRGIIYVALLSNTTCDDADYGSQWPVVVRTKGPKLFDKNAPGVVAYGEKLFTEATAGDGLIEFTIPLDYRADNVLPQRLVITCSASFWGDYYSGGAGSTMYLDDFEFIY